MSRAEFVRVDLSDGRNKALEQRLLRHFEAENRHRMAAANRDVLREIERERGFSLRRTRSQNQKFRALESRGQLVEFRVAGRNSGDTFTFAKYFFEALEIISNDVFDGNESCTHAIFGEREDRRLRVVENGVGPILAVERAHLNIV